MVLKYFKKHFIDVKIVAVFDIKFTLPLQQASIWATKNWLTFLFAIPKYQTTWGIFELVSILFE